MGGAGTGVGSSGLSGFGGFGPWLELPKLDDELVLVDVLVEDEVEEDVLLEVELDVAPLDVEVEVAPLEVDDEVAPLDVDVAPLDVEVAPLEVEVEPPLEEEVDATNQPPLPPPPPPPPKKPPPKKPPPPKPPPPPITAGATPPPPTAIGIISAIAGCGAGVTMVVEVPGAHVVETVRVTTVRLWTLGFAAATRRTGAGPFLVITRV
ncbi:hypothetical protein [Sphingomonas jatrophae]|uniref:Uncharacterized protein n=1 Tax=Sphingomonas jatrophae TaxID=1166337 RepID=A0A1I6JI14_9SPHN|nr:hypothetical protein [Sphingomonas jatrophae]SFR78595.1 hypothetical protein SAMN05192580_0298 [Sphingomonas jatrophae]